MEEKHKPNSHQCLIQDVFSSWRKRSELPLDLLSSVFERLSFGNFPCFSQFLMEKNRNPNSSSLFEFVMETYPSSSWSELPLDLLSSVFERLSFCNFQRAKFVCSSWYTASRQSVPKNHIPWLILFPKNKNSCTFFNLEEKDKLYKTQDLGSQDLGLGFSQCVCVTSYANWFLIRDPRYNLYIVNLFTNERINLPHVESQLGMTKIERTVFDWLFIVSKDNVEIKTKDIGIRCPVFWIDEKTKDYVVIWELRQDCVVYSKRGDNFWKQIPTTTDCADLAYKDHKLYFLSYSDSFKIFDFSGEVPRETFQCGVVVLQRTCVTTKLVFTATGDVLKVEKLFIPWFGVWSFHVYKFYSSGFLQVDSLGDEAMLFDLGITVLANDLDGFKRNSIYFNSGCDNNPNEIFLFNLETQESELLHKFDCSPIQLSSARWFLPSFKHT